MCVGVRGLAFPHRILGAKSCGDKGWHCAYAGAHVIIAVCIPSARKRRMVCRYTYLGTDCASFSVVWCSCSLPTVFPSLPSKWQAARVGARTGLCGLPLHSTWFGACVFIAVPEVRIGGQIRRCGHGLRSDGEPVAERIRCRVPLCSVRLRCTRREGL